MGPPRAPASRRAPGPSSGEKNPTTGPSSTSSIRTAGATGSASPTRPTPTSPISRAATGVMPEWRTASAAPKTPHCATCPRRLRQQRVLGRVDLRGPRPHRLHPGPRTRGRTGQGRAQAVALHPFAHRRRLSTTSCRTTLALQREWPWASALANAFVTLRSLPLIT